MGYKEIDKCRICGNRNLVSIVNLGNLYLTGVFPRTREQEITCGPLELVKCQVESQGEFCGLLQLKQSYDPNEMFGQSYGYRSALNKSMVSHLHNKVKQILKRVPLTVGDIVLDIGSNDSTLLQAYPKKDFTLVGIDPLGNKFREYYPEHIQLVPEFFSAESFKKHFDGKDAKIITSIAMFYDLEDPVNFMRQVRNILADDGIWIFEQSYMPTMLRRNAYDTICHEHLEYYAVKQIKWMTDRIGLKIVDIEFNDINGGSFSVVAAKENSHYNESTATVEKILQEESSSALSTERPYLEFRDRVYLHRTKLLDCLSNIKNQNRLILGYGASTKGNVILQFCAITEKDIPFIAEVNKDKFGCYTPGTNIPIISEEEAKRMKPDYFLALPWHFKNNFLYREKRFLENGGSLIMPLPELEIIRG